MYNFEWSLIFPHYRRKSWAQRNANPPSDCVDNFRAFGSFFVYYILPISSLLRWLTLKITWPVIEREKSLLKLHIRLKEIIGSFFWSKVYHHFRFFIGTVFKIFGGIHKVFGHWSIWAASYAYMSKAHAGKTWVYNFECRGCKRTVLHIY